MADGVNLSRKFVSESELDEIRKKRQEEWEKVHKPDDPEENMVKGLDEDETSFLDEVSRQQSLIEKHRRDEEAQEIKEYRSALQKLANNESQKETEKKAGPKPSENRTSHLSQAHLLAGAVKRHSSSQSSEGSKKQKAEESVAGNGSQTDQEAVEPKSPGAGVTRSGILHLPSAAVCVGILPGLGAYSGSSDSESSSDSEGLGAAPSPSQRCTT
ncbi:protein FAM192A-like isoform X4 [Sinocyclocheilus anshuiensis]|uniref:protein FAM192A-like isoform X4 n=1 Tax=Sinocyclocheilus anshuiensis TaxID=1608454 RepID=UPI0007B832AE|nr:PREDICTED: protein FAM192A-like isoform X4 [Sinocyclocheilus anshuiensis]